jgi:D-alanyl-D-alanine carboxypeptidase (penicillin-binding protein 5/6)
MRSKLKKLIIFILILALSNIFTVFADIDVSNDIRAAVCGDFETGEILYSYNSEEVVEIASITKLMTYLVAKEALKNNEVSLDDVVTVSQNTASTKGSSFGLSEGEEIKLSLLLDVILIVSGNDAAVAVAEHVSGSEEAFVERMNKKAEEIGITTARFINPNGMPIDLEETDQNFMSTADLFKLARYVLEKYPEITDTTDIEKLVIPERNYEKEATNPLLPEMDSVDGLKTGYTDKAGLCLISTAPVVVEEDNNKNRRVISIVMGARSHMDRIQKSIDLLEYGMYEYGKEKIIPKDELIDTIVIPNAVEMTLEIQPEKDYYHLVKKNSEIKEELNYQKYDNTAPINKGDVVGELDVYIEGEYIDTVNLIASRDVEKANFFTRAFRYLRSIFYN